MKDCAKKICLFLLGAIAMLSLAGCSSIDDDPPSKNEVLKHVQECVSKEKYELTSEEKFNDERPKRYVYHFKSADRDISFDATSTLKEQKFDSATTGYGKAISVNYSQKVHEFYLDRLKKIFPKAELNEYGGDIHDNYDISSFRDIEIAARKLAAAHELYKEELKYNSADWMQQYPLCIINLNYTGNGKTNKKTLYNEHVDGQHTYEEIFDIISYNYVNYIVSEKIKDATVPKEQYDKIHTNVLKDVYINGVNISKKALKEEEEQKLYNRHDAASFYGCNYYYPWKTYVMVLNVGLADDKAAPKLMEQYFAALGIKNEIRYGKGIIKWELGDDRWKIEAEKDAKGKYIELFAISRNSERLNIMFITSKNNMSPTPNLYTVAISIDDFAKIFNLNYKIDDKAGTIHFTKM